MRKTMYSTPVLVVLAIILFLVGKGTWNLFVKYSDTKEKTDEARGELLKLEEQKKDLEKRVSFLQTDRGREDEIRSKFMVAKEGEGVIMVVDPKATSTETVVSKKSSWWDRFLNFFR